MVGKNSNTKIYIMYECVCDETEINHAGDDSSFCLMKKFLRASNTFNKID